MVCIRVVTRHLKPIFDRSHNGIIGKTVFDIAPQEMAEGYLRTDRELITHPGILQYEGCVPAKNGQVRTVIFDKATIVDIDGDFTGIIGVITDITSRKELKG